MPDDPVLEGLLAELPPLPAELTDADATAWEQRVLASIEAKPSEPEPSGTQMFLARRRWLVWVGAAAMAAAVILYLVLHGATAPAPASQLALEDRPGPTHLGTGYSVGDTLVVRGPGILRVYDAAGALVASGTGELAVPLRAPGELRAIAFDADPGPSQNLDADLAAAGTAKIHVMALPPVQVR